MYLLAAFRRPGGHRRGGGGHVHAQDDPARPDNRHVQGRGDPRKGAQVPRDAPEERIEEKGVRKWARNAAEHAHAGEQAADASPGAARFQVSTIVSESLRGTLQNHLFSKDSVAKDLSDRQLLRKSIRRGSKYWQN